MALELDQSLVRLHRLLQSSATDLQVAQLLPDVGHLGIFSEDLLEELDGISEPAGACEIDGLPIFLEHVDLVLRIRQRLARGLRRHLGSAADVPERAQPLDDLC